VAGNDDYEDFARMLRIALGAADISVGALAQTLGVTKGKVVDWTRGEAVPTAEVLVAIEERLGMPPRMLSGALDRSRKLTRGALQLPGNVLKWVGLAQPDDGDLLVGFPTSDGGIDLIAVRELDDRQRSRVQRALERTRDA